MASLAARAKRSEQYAQTGEATPEPVTTQATPVEPKLVTPTSTPIVVTGRVPSAIVTNKTQEEKTASTLENAEFLNDTPANNQSGSKTPTEAPKTKAPKPEPTPTPVQETYGTHAPEKQAQNVYTGAQPVTKVEASDANIRVQPANIIMAINVYNTLRNLNKEKLVRVASFFKNDGKSLDEATVAVINYNPAIKNLLRNFKAMTELKVGHYQALAALYVRDLFDNEDGEQTVSALYDLVTALTDSKAEKPTSPTEYSLSISEEAQKIDETVYEAVATVEELIKIVDKS